VHVELTPTGEPSKNKWSMSLSCPKSRARKIWIFMQQLPSHQFH
jgi:hypothetical protein